MIRCVATKEKDRLSLQIVGHAEYNPGNDIICSAVSTLTQTFYRYVLMHETEMLIDGRVEVGNAMVMCKATPTTLAVFNACVDALIDISNTYGSNYLTVNDCRYGV